MNRKKLVSLCLVLALAITAAIGGTMAYFTDTDAEVNTFTTGNVEIDLTEDFVQDSELYPGVDVNKDVFVTNTGSEDAYVRVHLAFPKILDSGDPDFAAYANTLHWNFSKASIADGKWNWNADKDGANYPGNGGNWNSYEATIDGVEYTVYVATYETALTSTEKTIDAITNVYLDTKVTNEGLSEILDEVKQIKIYAYAQGVQKAGFDDAYAAFDAAYDQGDLANPWN